MRLMQPPTLGELPRITAGFFGPPGCTKTTLMAQFHQDPRTGPALWLDCGGNPDMLLSEGKLDLVLHMDMMGDIIDPLDYLLTGQKVTHPFYKRWKDYIHEPFKSIVVDTFSDWQGLLIDSIIGIKSDQLSLYSLDKVPTPVPTEHGKDIAYKTLFAARQMLIALPLHVFLGFQEYETVKFTAEGKKITGGAGSYSTRPVGSVSWSGPCVDKANGVPVLGIRDEK